MTQPRLLLKALVVVALGAWALADAKPVEARAYDEGACTRCVDATGCGLEEELCAAWKCGTIGMAMCGELGECTAANGKRLVVCNSVE